jgi:hypothetical protein
MRSWNTQHYDVTGFEIVCEPLALVWIDDVQDVVRFERDLDQGSARMPSIGRSNSCSMTWSDLSVRCPVST